MPRAARLDAPGVLHHVIGRGIEKKKIFLNDRDRKDFLSRIAQIANAGSMEVYAWALLPNHFHLLCKTGNHPLSSNMRKLLTGYVVNFNKRHKRHGHLFQNRYKSIVCQEDSYLKELVRYIHLNPLRSGLVKDLDELDTSPYSGHSVLTGNIERNWQAVDTVLSYFGSPRVQQKNYQVFTEEGVTMGKRPELTGGGLVRSIGGWAEVTALRKRGKKQVSDQRILGDEKFVKSVFSQMDDLGKKNMRVSKKRTTLDTLAKKVCQTHKISINELCSGSRRREIVEPRRVLSWLAVRDLGYSGAEVARYLGVTTSCVTRAASSGKRPKKRDYI
ncbi:MAG: transposase [Proteobacteria bacterium]|nr:transposase [Pseudomonadota bacterium]